MKAMHKALAVLIAGGAAIGAHAVSAQELPLNDYPTVTRADYVFACMQVNGQTRDMLDKCSCSIDQIASVITFNEYEEAETVKSVQMRNDRKVAVLNSPQMQEKIKNLKRAQVEAELRCF